MANPFLGQLFSYIVGYLIAGPCSIFCVKRSESYSHCQTLSGQPEILDHAGFPSPLQTSITRRRSRMVATAVVFRKHAYGAVV